MALSKGMLTSMHIAVRNGTRLCHTSRRHADSGAVIRGERNILCSCEARTQCERLASLPIEQKRRPKRLDRPVPIALSRKMLGFVHIAVCSIAKPVLLSHEISRIQRRS